MLHELRVRDLGVIEDVDLLLGPGLTVISGETGAGKTLVVEALGLLLGARADPSVVRAGAAECRVEGRLDGIGGEETILCRVVPVDGRSRAYIDDKMTPASTLEGLGRALIEIFGQHDHQTLLRSASQRSALDEFAGVDLGEVIRHRETLRRIASEIDGLGGSDDERERRLDILRFERDEIAGLGVSDPDEIAHLEAEEARLSGARALREAAIDAHDLLGGEGEGVARDAIGRAIEVLAHESLLAEHATRLRGIAAELDDLVGELRAEAEAAEEDPARLLAVSDRRIALTRLARKHGGTLGAVLAVAEEIAGEIATLERAEERREELAVERTRTLASLAEAERAVGDLRRRAAGDLARAVGEHFGALALEHAELAVEVPPEGLGDDVEFTFRANLGEAAHPLARVASGGELARVMLALRLVLSTSPPTLVFDEVDAGIGGEVGIAVGRALAELGRERQVLVVTHLAQVAAFADAHVVVEKRLEGGRTRSVVRPLDPRERTVELARMLSGQPESPTAQEHATELLALADAEKASPEIRTPTHIRL
jgi:DNA repair protein RecN (Recombination protein N)